MAKRTARKKSKSQKTAPEKRAALGLEERFGELAAWYILQGMDEATARERARDEMRDEPNKN